MKATVIDQSTLQEHIFLNVTHIDDCVDGDDNYFKLYYADGTSELYSKDVYVYECSELTPAVDDVRSYNVGNSDYSKHKFQVWDIWNEYHLNPFDADIIKRILRHKKGDTRKMDYEKVIHICKERIRQIDSGEDVWGDK